MIVYHGSYVVVKAPDVLHSESHLDFGKGFYVTSVNLQAERWAKRKAAFHGNESGIVSVFEMKESAGLNVLDFKNNLDQ